jgi:hypothetical protein
MRKFSGVATAVTVALVLLASGVALADPATTNQVVQPATHVARPAKRVVHPVRHVARPAAQVARPATQVARPAMRVARPARRIVRPVRHVARPATNAVAPAAQAVAPATHAVHRRVTRRTRAFDGLWSVAIFTRSGPCDPSYRYPARIIGGQVLQADNDFSYQLVGAVYSNGAISVTVSKGGQSATGYGRLFASRGGGLWSAAGGQCSGTWSALRRQ